MSTDVKHAKLDIETRQITALIPHPLNPRAHPNSQIEKIVYWLSKLGYYKSVVVQKGTDYILAGHGVVKSLASEGFTHVDVSIVDKPDEWAKALMTWDNKSGELSSWDQVNLIAIQTELMEFDVDMEEMGFELGEIDSMGGGHEIEEDEPPPVSEDELITQTGDLWHLGPHRVLCGDSTRKEDVELVMGGEKAVLMATDPPYGCNVGNVGFTAQRDEIEIISKDDLEGQEMQTFLEDVFTACLPSLIDHCAWYLWHAHLTQGYFAAAAAAAGGVVIHRQIIWKKQMFIFGRGDYHQRHEPCFYGWRKGYRPNFYGERNQDTVWEVDWGEKRSEVGHPTAKPLELFAIPMRNHTVKGDICIDPFMGSGSQLLAADQLDRVCYGLEIEPKYCDVIVKRYINHVGTTEGVYVERGGKRLAWADVR